MPFSADAHEHLEVWDWLSLDGKRRDANFHRGSVTTTLHLLDADSAGAGTHNATSRSEDRNPCDRDIE